MTLSLKRAAELLQTERETDGTVKPSLLFAAIRKCLDANRADRIIALMHNGVSLRSAMRLYEPEHAPKGTRFVRVQGRPYRIWK